MTELSSTSKTATALAVILILSFGAYVLLQSRSEKLKVKDLEEFLTARKSAITLGWSFFASAIGSWVITGPAQFGYYAGIVPVVSYAFAAAVPILFIAFFGGSMSKIYPSLLSLSDFVYWRFGRVTQVLTILITLLNMSAAIIAEYSTLMSLYSDFVGLGDNGAYVVVLTAIVTLLYTTYGGLKASIITDKVQGIVALYLVQVVVIYLAADFNKEDITENIEQRGFNASFVMNKFVKGTTEAGWGTVFTLPLSLLTATIFSEALWQRSWAAADEKVLKKAALFGSVLIFFVVGFFGALGVLVVWANLVEDPFVINQNLFAFQVFISEAGKPAVNSAIGVLILLLGTVMAESAIDSLQNGVGASFNGALLRYVRQQTVEEDLPAVEKKLFKVSRVLLIAVNVIYIIIGLQQYSVLSLFLVGNMVCICAFFPITLGFFPDMFYTPYLRDFIPISSFICSLVSTGIYSAIKLGGFSEGFEYAFWENINYEYPYFVAALVASFFWTAIFLFVSKTGFGEKQNVELVEGQEAVEVKEIEEQKQSV
eukprot:snap_masked-scaffold_28-processed-gene-1.16-mRNA-1 protein AED:0.06 eAED:1.00 QI:0/0/0/1/1/1/2/0/539